MRRPLAALQRVTGQIDCPRLNAAMTRALAALDAGQLDAAATALAAGRAPATR